MNEIQQADEPARRGAVHDAHYRRHRRLDRGEDHRFNHGIFTNILVGVCGAFVGGKLAEVLEIPVFGFWRTLISASIGAIIILWIWRMIRTRTA